MALRTAGVRRLVALSMAVMFFALLLLSALGDAYWPTAGKKTKSKSGTTVDYTNAGDGYVLIKQKAGSKRYKLRLSQGDDTYTYDLNNDGNFEVFALQLGNGNYKAQVYKQVSGSKYQSVSSVTFKANMSDTDRCYLYPNQYVWYTKDSAAVAQSDQLCANLSSDREKVSAVLKYVREQVAYDYILALTVTTGYLPDLDQLMEKKMGICFDIAALVACMLRVQGIKTQLVIGHADNNYHAWNLVYLDGAWERVDMTAEIAFMNVATYTQERWY